MINTKYIRIKMIEKNINIIQLSQMLNVNCNTVSRWLNGNNLNNIEKFLELLTILDIKIDEIKVIKK